jgi:predicted SAM-dependent methyltransferase
MNSEPQFMLCPAGTAQTASSRLRCHGLARELGRLGCKVLLGLDATIVPDLLYVQKRVTPEIAAHARRVRERGGHVVFDIDDWGPALDWVKADPALLQDFLALCSAVTVDTEVRAEVYAKDENYRAVPHLWVIPDPIDYVEQAMEELTAAVPAARRLRGCWFGNAPNLPPALPYIQAALRSDRLDAFGVITNAQFVPAMQQQWPMLATEAWQLETFAQRLREHDFCLLIHDAGTEGVQKSNNKMLAALAQGVVPLVSNTPAYAALAHEIGLPELVLDAPEDLASRLQPASMQALREGVRAQLCKSVLQQFMPGQVAAVFLDKATRLLQAPPNAAAPPVPVKLNLGCGDVPLPGYVNVDVAAARGGRQPDVCCDIRDLSAFADGHADEVMAIHVIEHFYRWEVVDLLKEWVRVLKPGGRLVLECPNLLTACQEILNNPESAAQPDQRGQRSMWSLYGDPLHKDPLMCHRWLYTPQSLAQIMHEAGLRQLEQMPPQFKARHPRDMRIEGIKPAP